MQILKLTMYDSAKKKCQTSMWKYEFDMQMYDFDMNIYDFENVLDKFLWFLAQRVWATLGGKTSLGGVKKLWGW